MTKRFQNTWKGELTEKVSEYKMWNRFRRCDIQTLKRST